MQTHLNPKTLPQTGKGNQKIAVVVLAEVQGGGCMTQQALLFKDPHLDAHT